MIKPLVRLRWNILLGITTFVQLVFLARLGYNGIGALKVNNDFPRRFFEHQVSNTPVSFRLLFFSEGLKRCLGVGPTRSSTTSDTLTDSRSKLFHRVSYRSRRFTSYLLHLRHIRLVFSPSSIPPSTPPPRLLAAEANSVVQMLHDRFGQLVANKLLPYGLAEMNEPRLEHLKVWAGYRSESLSQVRSGEKSILIGYVLS